jgi:hypothetical protein
MSIFKDMRPEELFGDWLEAKHAEQQATAKRREIEDLILEIAQVPDTAEGIQVLNHQFFHCQITRRFSRKVDHDLLVELAAEAGLTDHLPELFKFKPEINLSAWKAADPQITSPLLGAITTVATRPTFKIKIKE